MYLRSSWIILTRDLSQPLHLRNDKEMFMGELTFCVVFILKKVHTAPESSHEIRVLMSMNNHTTPKSWGDIWYYMYTCPPPWKILWGMCHPPPYWRPWLGGGCPKMAIWKILWGTNYARLKWAIAVRFRASSVNFLHFHLLLENAWLDFNQTWQESPLGVGDSKCSNSMCGPHGGPGGGPQRGQNHANFKQLLLQIQKENSQVM